MDNEYKTLKNIRSLISIGSFLQVAENYDIIWGTGMRMCDYNFNVNNLDIHAVRGPYTKKFLNDFNIDCPNIFGDPALLMCLYYIPNKIIGKVKSPKKYQIISAAPLA